MSEEFRGGREDEVAMQRRRETDIGVVAPLSELSAYDVAEGDPDIRDWVVRSSDGRAIGRVEDLVVDTGALRVRYIDIRLDQDAVGIHEERSVLAPVGSARLDESRDEVLLPIASSGVADVPAYRGEPLDRDYESSVRRAYGGESAKGEEFYAGEQYDDRRFWGSRREGREDRPYISRSDEQPVSDVERAEAGRDFEEEYVANQYVEREVPISRQDLDSDPETEGRRAPERQREFEDEERSEP